MRQFTPRCNRVSEISEVLWERNAAVYSCNMATICHAAEFPPRSDRAVASYFPLVPKVSEALWERRT